MTKFKNALILGIAALMAQSAQAAMIDFHFGPLTQTGAAATGNTSDIWNAANTTVGGPVLLKDVAGQPTGVSVSWTSGNAWGTTTPVQDNPAGTATDYTTNWLMRSYLYSYSYNNGPTNLAVTLTGLARSQAYTMVIYGAGLAKDQGANFTVTGASSYTGATSGADRKISSGAGDAYTTISVVSSATGTLKVTAVKGPNYLNAILNGFQLVATPATGSVATAEMRAAATTPTAPVATSNAAVSTPVSPNIAAAITAATSPSTTAAPVTRSAMTRTATTETASDKMIWGVCGHPFWADYASWVPGNVANQMSDINQLGATYYRVSFESGTYLDMGKLAVPAQAAGITLLPNLPVHFVAASSAQTNYSNNYTLAYTWANYAIAHGYKMPYWELGNEVENWGLVNVLRDGSSPTDYTDITPGAFVAIASGMDGAYDGLKDAYTAGRAANQTSITPQIMMGMCYRHWGLLAKIQAYNNGVLPCDLISWHWYGPTYGDFNSPVNYPGDIDNGRKPSDCLADFKSKTDPTKPMDVWMTETNRILEVNGVFLNGSVADASTPATSQDWASEATAIQQNIESFKNAANVKAIFVYELYDEPIFNGASNAQLAAEGFFGLSTGLGGTKKDAFYTYQAEIKAPSKL